MCAPKLSHIIEMMILGSEATKIQYLESYGSIACKMKKPKLGKWLM